MKYCIGTDDAGSRLFLTNEAPDYPGRFVFECEADQIIGWDGPRTGFKAYLFAAETIADWGNARERTKEEREIAAAVCARSPKGPQVALP